MLFCVADVLITLTFLPPGVARNRLLKIVFESSMLYSVTIPVSLQSARHKIAVSDKQAQFKNLVLFSVY
jgi:hypothetical protein